MSFEDIPEDRCESFPCDACGIGNITLNEDKTAYECDVCNAYHEIKKD